MRLIIAAVAASVILSGGAAVAASLLVAPVAAQEQPAPEAEPDHRGRMKHRGGCRMPLRGLIEEGTITEAQARAIHDAFRASLAEREVERFDRAEKVAALDAALDGLVEDETITADQADAVREALEDRRARFRRSGDAAFRFGDRTFAGSFDPDPLAVA